MVWRLSIIATHVVAQYYPVQTPYWPDFSTHHAQPAVGLPQYLAPVYTDLTQPAYGTPQMEVVATDFSAPIHTDFIHTDLSQPVYGIPQYDFAPPVYVDFATETAPLVTETTPPALEEAFPGSQEIPHPDIVAQEQNAYAQTAAKNLAIQREAEVAKLEAERAKIVEDSRLRTENLISVAESQHQERLKTLDDSFNDYQERLAQQAQNLKMQYYNQRARDRFEAAEKKIQEVYRTNPTLEDLEKMPSMTQEAQSLRQQDMQDAQSLRQQNREQYDRTLELLSRGVVPDDLVVAPPADSGSEMLEDTSPADSGSEVE